MFYFLRITKLDLDSETCIQKFFIRNLNSSMTNYTPKQNRENEIRQANFAKFLAKDKKSV